MPTRFHVLSWAIGAGELATSSEAQVDRCSRADRVPVAHCSAPVTEPYKKRTIAEIKAWWELSVLLLLVGLYTAPAKSEAVTVSADSLAVNGCVYNRAVGQGIVGLYCNGAISGIVDFPPGNGSYQISITARGDLVPGLSPNAQVSIDGSVLANLSVTTSEFSTFTQNNVSDTAGKHALSISFTNDYYNPSANQDLNLYIQSITIAANVPPTTGPSNPGTIVLNVGPGGRYETISDAVAAADADTNPSNYYDVQVTPGTYTNDFPVVTRPMTIEVDPRYAGQNVVLNATVDLPNQKGIILAFANLTVNGLVFTGAHIVNALGGNGAGIRDQNTDPAGRLVIQNSVFSGNQEGVLTGDNAGQMVTVVNSSFINNGNPDVNYFQHGLYVNQAYSLTVSNSLFCGQLIGHEIKSRAQVTMINNNQIYDGAADPAQQCNTGSSSLAIDVANGGTATISGNQIVQGSTSANYKLVDYGEEGLWYTSNSLLVSGNDFTSTGTPNATAVYDPNCVPARLPNNNYTGITTIVDPPTCAVYE